MTQAIHEFGPDAHGDPVSSGRYVVSPDGARLVLLAARAPLKAGWRLATEQDLAASQALESARLSREATANTNDHVIRTQNEASAAKAQAKADRRADAKELRAEADRLTEADQRPVNVSTPESDGLYAADETE
jgi:hypothetical protein